MYSIATMCNLESARRARARTGIEWTSQVGSGSEVRVYLTGRGPGEISWGDDTKTAFEWPQLGVAYTHLYEDGRQRLVECSVTGDITSLKVTSTIPVVIFRRLDAPQPDAPRTGGQTSAYFHPRGRHTGGVQDWRQRSFLGEGF